MHEILKKVVFELVAGQCVPRHGGSQCSASLGVGLHGGYDGACKGLMRGCWVPWGWPGPGSVGISWGSAEQGDGGFAPAKGRGTRV